MNITFQNQNNQNRISDIHKGDYTEAVQGSHTKEKSLLTPNDFVNVDFSDKSFRIPNALEELHGSKEKSRTLADIQSEAAFTDVGISQDYMTLMSHTMSDADYKKLSEEGFDFAAMNPEEAVTIVDKIKAELVKSGQHIAGYTDDLDMDTLAAAVGSEALAQSISHSFAQADIPLTQENVAAVGKAWTMAAELNVPTEGTYQYMVDNELEPEIANFYLAQNSGANMADVRNGNQDADAYPIDENLSKQIDQVLEQAGYEVNEENRQEAKWLMANRLPLTEESLHRLERLKEAVVPVTEEAFAQAVTGAIAEGKSPLYGNLSMDAKQRSVYEKAVEITSRKQLEEIRLRMTAEVNVKLLKSGFAIDTEPMEVLIEALRKAEAEVADSYFPDDAEAVSKYQNWNRTNQVMQELPGLPAQLLGTVRIDVTGEVSTVLSHFHAEGVALQQTLLKAGESYEALMTAPRADLGDNIRKAFGNIEELVKELGLDPTDTNSRIVRILGYNQMEITEENFNRVQTADEQVRRVIEKMTPAATLKMIRDGVNPLEESLSDLNRYFDNLPEEYRSEAESYSRYLYGLEQNKQITEAEKETYIGVYRLLHQIEKKDGAAIGAVVNSQAELQFANLLSAVRSGKFKHMDVRATDELGMLKELVKKGETASISEQIMGGYERERLRNLREISKMNEMVPAMLERGEIPVNAENLLAAQGMLQGNANPFKTLREKADELQESANLAEAVHRAEGLWELLEEPDSFRDSYEESVNQLQKQTENLTFEVAESSLDVRLMQTMHRQLGIMGSLSQSREYFVPMYVGEEQALVHLTMESSTTAKGIVTISIDMGSEEEGNATHMEAHLQVNGSRVEGYLLGKTSAEVTKLQEAADIFYNLINENTSMELEAVKLPVVSKGNINLTRTSGNNSQGEGASPDNGTLYHVAKLFLQAIR